MILDGVKIIRDKLVFQSVSWYLALRALLFVSFSSLLLCNQALAMPKELRDGMIKFEVNSGRYFQGLSYMDEDYIKNDPVSFATALLGFHLKSDAVEQLDRIDLKDESLEPNDFFEIGRVEYRLDRCVPALKAFKGLRNKLSLDEKQEWAFYRSNCFVKLGSRPRAGQALSDILSGIWISHAYYNLAMGYAETSSNKTKALLALRAAASLNAGKTKEEQELNDRINFAAGSIYLEAGKPDLATEFFKKVHLDSASAPQAMYLNGIALLELNDFRSATQSWFAVKKYPVIHPGVSESYLAVPYAFERSGYVNQALESYIDASKTFKIELDTVEKVEALVEKYGFRKSFMEENTAKGLEWFLAKDIATNTRRASYYKYLMADDAFYDLVELLSELRMLENVMTFWRGQLEVFEGALSNKKKAFSKNIKSFDRKSVQKRVSGFEGRYRDLLKTEKALNKQVGISDIGRGIDALSGRLVSLASAVKEGRKKLDRQIGESKSLNKRINSLSSELSDLMKELDTLLGDKTKEELDRLEKRIVHNHEQAEQGLIHILEHIAEQENLPKSKANRGAK